MKNVHMYSLGILIFIRDLRIREEFTNVSNYGRTMETRLQEIMQEDEGATIRIGKLEHKLRLVEQMADHICGRYKEPAKESNQEQSEFHAMNHIMENVPSELQEAIGQIHKQTQRVTTVNMHAQIER